MTYCELGTVVPRSGGEHSYFQAAFKPLHPFWGQIPSFLFAFITVTLIKPSSLALLSLSFAQYTILPILTGLGVSDEWIKEADYERAHKLLAICCACKDYFQFNFCYKFHVSSEVIQTIYYVQLWLHL